jgi:2-polyprenyl-6-methoxyphenol hydroxylase-like FAD-dependent oxidoreductase
MHIPRQTLRKILLDKVYQTFPNPIIKWKSNLNSVSYTQDKVTLKFDSKHEEVSDLVIGCDGIYSILRKYALSSNEGLTYLGIIVVLGLCGSDHPLTKERVFQTADGEARLFSMPFIKDNPSLSTMWQLSLPIDQTQA